MQWQERGRRPTSRARRKQERERFQPAVLLRKPLRAAPPAEPPPAGDAPDSTTPPAAQP
jgi:hypothetical protein